MIDAQGRPGIQAISSKVGRTLASWGFTPDWITLTGLVLAVPAAILIAAGFLWQGFVVAAVAAILDVFDGAVAKARGGGTRRGGFFDATADRVVDTLYFGSLAWYLGRDDFRLAVLAMACMGLSMLVSYLRAKAGELGFNAHVGIMERAERLAVLGIGVLVEIFVPGAIVVALWIVLALSVVTVAQRFMAVWRQGTAEPPVPLEQVRLIPEFKEIRDRISANRHEGATVVISVRRVWESSRAEWEERRVQARARRLAARDERRRVSERLTSERAAHSTRRPRRRGKQDGSRRP